MLHRLRSEVGQEETQATRQMGLVVYKDHVSCP